MALQELSKNVPRVCSVVSNERSEDKQVTQMVEEGKSTSTDPAMAAAVEKMGQMEQWYGIIFKSRNLWGRLFEKGRAQALDLKETEEKESSRRNNNNLQNLQVNNLCSSTFEN